MTADAVGGVWTYALDLARGLRAHGVETTLLVNGPPPAAVPADLAVVATGLPLDWLAEEPAQLTVAGRRLAEAAGDLRADVVQLNSPAYASDVGFPAPVVGVQHSCTATWWRTLRGAQPLPPDLRWRRESAWRGLLACDAVVAPTHAFASLVHRTYELAAPLHVVWNGRAPPDEGAPLTPYVSDHCVFTAGRLWDEGKGMATLDAAAARIGLPVRAAGPLAAPGGEPVRLPHLDTLGMLSAPALQEKLRQVTVFVAPSVYEPFGLAVLEAAQRAKPLILADIPTFRELWNGAAAFFTPGDVDGLARLMDGLMGSALGRTDQADAAHKRSRRYSVEAMAAGMMDVLTRVQLRRS